MGSKIILDSPALLDESLVTLTEACRLFPVPCSRPAIERWIRRGSQGVILESVLVCGRRMTSKAAIDRFVRAQLHVEAEHPTLPKGGMSKSAIAEASKKYRLPEPLQGLAEN